MKKVILAALIAMFAAKAFPQQDDYSVWTDFRDNWHVDATGGVQTLFAPDFGELPFGKQVTPHFSLGVGKWVNPFWGFHFSMDGYSYNGYRAAPIGAVEPFSPLYNVDLSYEGAFRYYLRYMGLNLDFRFSLLNLIAGRKRANSLYDLIPYVGFGYMHAFPYRGTTKQNILAGHLGFRNRFAVCDRLDVNLDVTSRIFDNYVRPVDSKYVASLGVSVGVTYHFGKKAFRKPVVHVPMETVRYRTDTVLVREVPGKERVVEKVLEERSVGMIMASIRFDINRTQPFPNQETQLVDVANFLRANAESAVRIEGYADATTGSEHYNKELGEKRAETVRRLLVDRYGVNERQITVEAVGADAQPYGDEPAWNCVAIIRLVK